VPFLPHFGTIGKPLMSKRCIKFLRRHLPLLSLSLSLSLSFRLLSWGTHWELGKHDGNKVRTLKMHYELMENKLGNKLGNIIGNKVENETFRPKTQKKFKFLGFNVLFSTLFPIMFPNLIYLFFVLGFNVLFSTLFPIMFPIYNHTIRKRPKFNKE
jgi:hypothetical protein